MRVHPLAVAAALWTLTLCGSARAAEAMAASGTLRGLTGHGVNHLETSIPGVFIGADVAPIIGAERFYNAGIYGQGSSIANIEAGHIWLGHETLGHVSQYVHDSTAWDDPDTPDQQQIDLYDRHATWVGMILGGRGAADHQTGVAPQADLKSGALADQWDSPAYSPNFDFNSDSFTTPLAAYFGAVDAINCSWGGAESTGTLGWTIAMDGLAMQNARTTFVVSAGNDGPGTNTVGAPGSGYNAITVGALQNDGDNRYDTVATFSSRGPQDYGDPVHGLISGVRAAVDIAAPGTDLVAAYYGGQTGGNNPTLDGSPAGPLGGPTYYSYALAGTSFAAPVVTGAAALIDSASYNTAELAGNPQSRDARVVKAVLLNSARKPAGWDNGQSPHPNGNGGVHTTQSLDWDSGAGALDLNRAYARYLNAGTRDVPGTLPGSQIPVDPLGWDFGVVADGTTNVYPIDRMLSAGAGFTVTLDWFRDRTFDPQTQDWDDLAQANLELAVRDTLSGLLISDSVSTYNVVEHLDFDLPADSFYQIEVWMNGTTFGDLPEEEYGLAWRAVPEPATLSLAGMALLGLAVAAWRRRRAGRE